MLKDVEATAGEPQADSAAQATPATAHGAPATAQAAPATAQTAPATATSTPMSPTRRAVARRMSASAQIPQFDLARDVDVRWLLAQKESLAGGEVPGLSLNDLILQALAETVRRHPDLANSYLESQDGGQPLLRRTERVDIGLAVATERGLLVPVVRGADELSLREIAAERARLVAAARDGTLGLAELSGATVSVSNLGGFGVDRFTAMINPGEAAILAVGRVLERVMPYERGIQVAPVLTLTLTLDHRVLDGAAGGAAIAELAALLQGAMTWRP
jgi:pyruvate dehydrogenase E2 component (dihydrolipoamide acetyltransferase)